MVCLCSQELQSLLNSLPSIPPLSGLVPPLPPNLLPAISAAMVVGTPAALPMPPLAKADAALMANLATMANLSAAVRAAAGINLAAPVPPMAMASLQASLAAQINSMNANGAILNPGRPNLAELLRALANLLSIAGLVSSVRAAFGLNLRASGAVPALQARLSASARASASATASAQASATASLSMVGAAMAALGFPATPQGAVALTASMNAMSGWTQRLPALTVNFNALSLLAALLAALAMIRSALGVNLLAPRALVSLRASLHALPLAALASLNVSALASARASAQLSAAASASAVSTLGLHAAASTSLLPAARLSVMMRLTAHAPLLLPPGSCGRPCPLALVPGLAA